MTRHTAPHDVLLEELLKEDTDPKEILGEQGLLRPLTTRVVVRSKGIEGAQCVSCPLPLFPSLEEASAAAMRHRDQHLPPHCQPH